MSNYVNQFQKSEQRLDFFVNLSFLRLSRPPKWWQNRQTENAKGSKIPKIPKILQNQTISAGVKLNLCTCKLHTQWTTKINPNIEIQFDRTLCVLWITLNFIKLTKMTQRHLFSMNWFLFKINFWWGARGRHSLKNERSCTTLKVANNQLKRLRKAECGVQRKNSTTVIQNKSGKYTCHIVICNFKKLL